MSTKSNKWYGWIPDLPDRRDMLFMPPRATIPDKVDLRGDLQTAIYDQGNLGSCTANAIAAGFSYAFRKGTGQEILPSRLFIYYNERVMIDTVKEDSGAMIRDGIKSLVKQGVCPEKQWSYTDAGTKFKRKPSVKCYKEALNHQLIKYQRVAQNPNMICAAIAAGFPVVAGFTVYDSFEDDDVAKTGNIPIPAADEGVLGGHAILIVGYEKGSQRFIVRNSWGADWGDKGYCYMPFAIEFEDLWAMSIVEQ